MVSIVTCGLITSCSAASAAKGKRPNDDIAIQITLGQVQIHGVYTELFVG